MIVQVNRAFKSYSFCHQKKGYRLCMIFSPTLLQGYTGASIPNFNINVPFFYCSFFFEGYLKAQVKEMKMVSGDNYGNYHPGLSGNAFVSQKIEYRYFYSCRINQKLACEHKKKKKERKRSSHCTDWWNVPLLGGRPKSVTDDIFIEFIKTPVLNGISADPCRRSEKKSLTH